MTSTYTGVFLRDALNQTPDETTKTWTASPDLFPRAQILYTQYPYFVSSTYYDTNWAQNAVYSATNFVYVRGDYYDNGTVVPSSSTDHTVRAYLYYADPDTMNKPSTWQSAGISWYDPVFDKTTAQNYGDTKVQTYTSNDGSISGYGMVATFEWIPPALSASGKPYRLITYVSNDDTDFDPTKDLPADLGNDAQMLAFFNGKPNMACHDTTPFYGLFVRDSLTQTSYQAVTNAMASPDIIVSGITPNNDPANLITTTSYSKQPTEGKATLNMWNHVYIRGKDILPITDKPPVVWLFYCDSRIDKLAYPDNWQSSNILYQGKEQNYAILDGLEQDQIALADFWWQPPAMADGQTSYTLIVWVDNNYKSSSGTPTIFPGQDIGFLGSTAAEVSDAVAGHFNMAMYTVTMATPSPAPTVQGIASIPVPLSGDTIWLGAKFQASSAGGQYFLTSTGTSTSNTIVVEKADVGPVGQMALQSATGYDGTTQPFINYAFYAPANAPGGVPLDIVAYQQGANGVLTPITVTNISQH